MTGEPRRRSELAVLFSIVVVDLVGFGVVMPILPFYAREYGASATELGLVLMVYAAAQFACAPLWGRVSDRIGRRPVLLFTIAGTAVSLLLLGLADSLAWIFAARGLAGAFAANVSVASAYIADVTEESERTRWMGMLGASFGVGFVLGPAIGGALAPYGYHVPMLTAAGLAAANFAVAVVRLREPARHDASDAAGIGATRLGVLRDPLIRRLCLTNLAFSVAVTQLETIFAFFMMDRFDYGARQVAFILVGMAVVMGGIQGGGMRALSARFRDPVLVSAGGVLLAAAMLWVPEAGSVSVLLLPLALAAAGRAVLQPALMGMASLAAARGTRGVVMGTFQSAASLARVIGPVAAGWLYDRSQGAPFWLAGALLLGVAASGRGLPAQRAAGDAAAAGALKEEST